MVTPKYYSQAGQEEWVFDLLNFKRNGFFVANTILPLLTTMAHACFRITICMDK